jgi:hypothetical protein
VETISHTSAGTVIVTNDGGNIYLLWTSANGFKTKEFHIYIGISRPATSNILTFPYSYTLTQPVQSAQFSIPFPERVTCGCTIYVSFEISVSTGWNSPLEPAWSTGTSAPAHWHQWANYNNYKVCCCSGFSHLHDLLGTNIVQLQFGRASKAALAETSLTVGELQSSLSDMLQYPAENILVINLAPQDNTYSATIKFLDNNGLSGNTLANVLLATPETTLVLYDLENVQFTVEKRNEGVPVPNFTEQLVVTSGASKLSSLVLVLVALLLLLV